MFEQLTICNVNYLWFSLIDHTFDAISVNFATKRIFAEQPNVCEQTNRKI